MTTDDMKLLDAIQSSYEKRIELGEFVARARNLDFLSLLDSDSEWGFMEAIGVLQCVVTADQHPFNFRSASPALL